MKNFLLLPLLLLISLNASAATFKIVNVIKPATILVVRYQICIGENPCIDSVAEVHSSLNSTQRFMRPIFVPMGQYAIVRGLTGTYYDEETRFIGRTVEFADCSKKFSNDNDVAFIIKKEEKDVVLCVAVG